MKKLMITAMVVLAAACAKEDVPADAGAAMDSAAGMMADTARTMMDSTNMMMDSTARMVDSTMARDTAAQM